MKRQSSATPRRRAACVLWSLESCPKLLGQVAVQHDRDLRTGALTGRIQRGSGLAGDDAFLDGPCHGRLGVRADLASVGVAAQSAGRSGLTGVAIQDRRDLLTGQRIGRFAHGTGFGHGSLLPSAQGDAGIVPAKAQTVAQCVGHGLRTASVRHIVQITFGIGLLIVDGGRRKLVMQGQRCKYGFDAARTAQTQRNLVGDRYQHHNRTNRDLRLL